MNQISLNKYDEMVMKLLHYFITVEGYSPIILHGAKNEIWLENMHNDYKIVRIVTNYIHNDEQYDFDIFRTKKIMSRIKRKTFSFDMNGISIFLNLGENVHFDKKTSPKNLLCIHVDDMDELINNKDLTGIFPDLKKDTDFKEEGMELLIKVTSDINKKNEEEARKVENVFKIKKPIITYTLIGLCILVYILMTFLGNGSYDNETLLKYGALFKPFVTEYNEYFRLITCAFVHIGIVHLFFNMYALYVIGAQLESFLGKFQYLVVYLFSALTGSIMSCVFTENAISAGASGAIFGLLGSLLYFGYHYRVYLGNVLKSQIIPLLIFNLLLGVVLVGVDSAAHIGGMIGGLLMTMALGIKYKSTTSEKINGWILTTIFTAFIIYMAFFI